VPDTPHDGLVLGVPANADHAPPFNLNMALRRLFGSDCRPALSFSVTLVGAPTRPFHATTRQRRAAGRQTPRRPGATLTGSG
jgi:hypothetical protein